MMMTCVAQIHLREAACKAEGGEVIRYTYSSGAIYNVDCKVDGAVYNISAEGKLL